MRVVAVRPNFCNPPPKMRPRRAGIQHRVGIRANTSSALASGDSLESLSAQLGSQAADIQMEVQNFGVAGKTRTQTRTVSAPRGRIFSTGGDHNAERGSRASAEWRAKRQAPVECHRGSTARLPSTSARHGRDGCTTSSTVGTCPMATIEKYETVSGTTLYRARHRTSDRRQPDKRGQRQGRSADARALVGGDDAGRRRRLVR